MIEIGYSTGSKSAAGQDRSERQTRSNKIIGGVRTGSKSVRTGLEANTGEEYLYPNPLRAELENVCKYVSVCV
jgi:hypothetical protein